MAESSRSSVTVSFVMDDAYLREFHGEMVRVRLPRWRLHARVASFCLGAAILCVGWGLAVGRVEVLLFAMLSAVLGGGMHWRLRRRRERWLAYQRRLPTFGARITTEVDRGRLVQRSDRQTDVVAIPTGELVESPRGWFVTYDILLMGTEVTDPSVSTQRASAYLPESAFEQGVTRDGFAAELAATFRVQRLGQPSLDAGPGAVSR
jgi:hypothetical protein